MARGQYKIKWNMNGFREIRNFNTTQGLCLKYAKKGLEATGTTNLFECDVRDGRNRCHALIKTHDFESIRHNAYHNSLLKALGASGLSMGETGQ